MAVSPDFSGQCVSQYLLISQIGSGATGCVYRAVDTSSKQHSYYALKCIPTDNLSPRELLQRMSELFHHQLLNGCSPFVLPLRDVIQQDHSLWMVLDLCEGGDLFTAIWHNKVYWRNDALIKETFVAILDGVYACHKQGIFHRDLKPANILCGNDGSNIWIADFGLSTRTRMFRGHRCGTAEYMSPECNEKMVCYPALSDIWSLGIILINMVTGICPWRVPLTSDEGFRTFLENEDYLLETLPISRSLNELLKWMLHPNALQRLRIPQIKKAILRMESFYRWPRLPFEDLTRSRKVAWEVKFRSYADPEDLRRYRYSPPEGEVPNFFDTSEDSEEDVWVEDVTANPVEVPHRHRSMLVMNASRK